LRPGSHNNVLHRPSIRLAHRRSLLEFPDKHSTSDDITRSGRLLRLPASISAPVKNSRSSYLCVRKAALATRTVPLPLYSHSVPAIPGAGRSDLAPLHPSQSQLFPRPARDLRTAILKCRITEMLFAQ